MSLIFFSAIKPKKKKILYQIRKSENSGYKIYQDGYYIKNCTSLIDAIEEVDALEEKLIKDKEVTIYHKKVKI